MEHGGRAGCDRRMLVCRVSRVDVSFQVQRMMMARRRCKYEVSALGGRILVDGVNDTMMGAMQTTGDGEQCWSITPREICILLG